MRSFEGNLRAYHALNALQDLKVSEFARRTKEAKTMEEQEQIMAESDEYFKSQGKLYSDLGEEMVHIMKKDKVKWWKFWKL